MRVAAQLDLDVRARADGQVDSHRQGGAAVEGERRHRHPAVAHGHELRDPGRRLLLEECHRIRTVRGGRPRAEGVRGQGGARCGTGCSARVARRLRTARSGGGHGTSGGRACHPGPGSGPTRGVGVGRVGASLAADAGPGGSSRW